MFEHIFNCNQCNLCINQRPFLDTAKKHSIFWVGLSAKKKDADEFIPLSSKTNTGKVLDMIERDIPGIVTYRTNLVKCLPLDNKGKLRYPTKEEMGKCIRNLNEEITELSPQIVFLLGEQVSSAVCNYYNLHIDKWNHYGYHFTEYQQTYYVPIHHPSYIYIYKKKEIAEYIEGVKKVIFEAGYKS